MVSGEIEQECKVICEMGAQVAGDKVYCGRARAREESLDVNIGEIGIHCFELVGPGVRMGGAGLEWSGVDSGGSR
jgi:hypothetical protein